MKPPSPPPRRPDRAKRGRFPAWLGAAALASAASLACSASDAGSTGEPAGELTGSIKGGTADGEHHNVFLLVSHHEGSGSLCTATLIAPNLLLTARHCVSPGDDEQVLCGDSVLGAPYPPQAFFATNDARPNDASPFFGAHSVEVPAQGTDTCGYDIALVVLNALVPSTIAAPAVPRIDREVVPGELYTAVGYGVDENGDPTDSRMQRAGLEIACQPGSCGPGVESTEFRGEDGICSGDSGGPALDEDGKVVGVVSRGAPNCSTPVYGTVTAWRDFIVQVATDAAELGGYAPPFWVLSGVSDPPPEPGAGGAGGGSGAGGGPSDAPGAEGDRCRGSSGCAEGLICYAAGGDVDGGSCVPECSRTSDCASGLVCEDLGSASVCVEPSGGADRGGGCSIAPAGRDPLAAATWLGTLAALGLLLIARRKK